MPKKVVDTLILDLDNTIFDWFDVWYASFYPLYQEIIRVTGRPASEIDSDIRKVHQLRRTSEYTFLLEELDALNDLRKDNDIRSIFADAIEISRRRRDFALRLYPSVFRCLWDLKKTGTKIVAYTESMSFYSAYRLKRFGLDGVIDVLFSPEDHDLPAGISLDKMRRLPDEYYELQVTQIKHTPPGELKPNPRILLDIIESIGARSERCAYVGDSLFKDVAMARDAGVFDIHAKYGTSQHKSEYSLLQRVSHWTEADVERERVITAKGTTFEPSAILKDNFAEIFIYCDFVSFDEPNSDVASESINRSIDIWKKVVDVQQHFNDLEMRIRNFAITVVGVLIASVGFTYQYNLKANIFGFKFAAGLGLIVAAGIVWLGFFLMDRFWYHILLRGAVKHGLKIEKSLMDSLPAISLGTTISEESKNVKLFCIKMNSERRLEAFYIIGLVMILIIFFALAFAVPSPNGAAGISSAV